VQLVAALGAPAQPAAGAPSAAPVARWPARCQGSQKIPACSPGSCTFSSSGPAASPASCCSP
jgi:hypothetical protein